MTRSKATESHFLNQAGVEDEKNVLCCAAGMSTSMLVQRMLSEAQTRGLDVEIVAVPIASFESIIDSADVVLLGPQVRYELPRLSAAAGALGKKVEMINMMDYGTMRGDKVLDAALELIGGAHESV
jgi:PTS system cellobiose-specific IIB component